MEDARHLVCRWSFLANSLPIAQDRQGESSVSRYRVRSPAPAQKLWNTMTCWPKQVILTPLAQHCS